MRRSEGRVALVTGSAPEIAATLVRDLAREGAKLVVPGIGDFAHTTGAIEREGGKVIGVKADTTNTGGKRDLVRGAEERLGPKTITVFLDASPAGNKRAAHAASLAERWGAHLVGIHEVFAGVMLPASMCWARGDEAMRQVVDYERHLESNAEAAAFQVGEHFRVLCNDLKVSGEFRPIGREDSVHEASRLAFHSDLVVVGLPEPNGLPDNLSIDKLLLASSAPLLIVPTAWKGRKIGNKILIGWNDTREARRAVTDAMPFLVAAESVTVLAIDPDERHRHGDNQGSGLAICLRRYGANIHLDQVSSRGHSVSTALLSYAEQSASDLLVVGAYSHPRLKEVLLGGTTRTLLETTSIPTLMSG